MDRMPDLIAKLFKDRRQLIILAVTAAVWITFEILGDPNPLDARETGALLLVVAAAVYLGDWVWRRLRAH